MSYALHILIMITIYLILSLSLNLLVGYTGLLSICHAAFYGIGAYTSTLLIVKLGLSFPVALICGVLMAMLLSLLVAYPSLRLKGDYFVLTSLGFQIIVFSILYNWVGLTRGPYGIPGIPRPNLFGIEFGNLLLFLLLSAILASIVILVIYRLTSSPFGRALKAIREDELVTLALGKNVARFKIWSFVIASGIAAISGSLYAGYVTYIDPTSFTLDESIFILAIILVGGSGNLKGPIVGTAFMIILPEILRFLGIPDTIAPNVRQMIYGALLVLLMRYRSQGIAGEYKFE
jgi:branched-chain amino acid transport system permease protein